MFEMLHSRSDHLGIHKTLEKVKELFFWPGYEQKTKDAVRSCDSCQHLNSPVLAPQAALCTIKSEHPFQRPSTTGYTLYFIMSGRPPNLPIDILLGQAQTQGQELPDYVKKTQSSLKSAFSVVRQRLHEAH